MTVLEILSLLVLAFWCIVAIDVRRWWPGRSAFLLPGPVRTRPLDGHRGLAVIVPARNEAAVLRETLPSLLAQGDDFSLLVLVDDRSTDGTGALAREIAAASPWGHKVLVIDGEPVPTGWTGKLFALRTGLRFVETSMSSGAPQPRWLLFTDADIRHPEGSLSALLARAEDGPFDLVSVMVRLRAESFWEQLLIPPFVYFFQAMYPFRRVSDPRSRVAAAAGGCVLLRAEALKRFGGLESVRSAIIDDVTLARRVKDSGGRCWLGLQPDMLSVRRYERLGEIVDMVARTAFTQLGYRYALLAATLAFLVLFFVAPPILVAGGLVGGSWLTALAAAGAWILQSATLLPVVAHERVPAPYALSLPLASALYGAMTAISGWRHLRRRGVSWRGRTVS